MKTNTLNFPPVIDQPGEGLSARIRTDCNPHANNRLFRSEIGVLQERC